jgi:hypothetical protein
MACAKEESMIAIRESIVKADLFENVLEAKLIATAKEAESVGYIAAKLVGSAAAELVGSAVDTKAMSTTVGQTGQIPKLFVGEIEVE